MRLRYIFTANAWTNLNLSTSVHSTLYPTIDFDMNLELVKILANMSYNAYTSHNSSHWNDIPLNNSLDIGYHDTIHAYLFSDESYSKNIIAFKGTSVNWFESADDDISSRNTVYNDKLNDNLYFSCCYYSQTSLYNTTSICEPSRNERRICQKDCYTNSLKYSFNYYNIALDIMKNITKTIDLANSELIFTGHSLGGTIATLMGIEYNKTVVTFESPGEKHYIDLLGLDYTYVQDKIYHFGHNADTLFTGKCHGISSLCYLGGYMIYTKCHIGNVCEYDSIGNLGLSDSILTHKLKYVIDHVMKYWDNLPVCVKNTTCTDCETWSYV